MLFRSLKTEIMIEDLHNKMNHILTKESAILKLLQEEKEKQSEEA